MVTIACVWMQFSGTYSSSSLLVNMRSFLKRTKKEKDLRGLAATFSSAWNPLEIKTMICLISDHVKYAVFNPLNYYKLGQSRVVIRHVYNKKKTYRELTFNTGRAKRP